MRLMERLRNTSIVLHVALMIGAILLVAAITAR